MMPLSTGVMRLLMMSIVVISWAYGNGKGMIVMFRAWVMRRTPLASSWYTRETSGADAWTTPSSTL
eukprot:16044737-Heterocapsa_arctica.AAC.1